MQSYVIVEDYEEGEQKMKKYIDRYNYGQYMKGNTLVVPNDIFMIYDDAFRMNNIIRKVVFDKESTIQYIGIRCFENSNIEEIHLPESVVSIGIKAFSYCRSLKKFSCGDKITDIGSRAFSGTGIKTFKVPNSLNYIGEGAFNHTKIERINVNTLEHWLKICFADSGSNPSCGGNAHLYIGGRMAKSLRIPKNIDTIMGNTFCGIKGIERVHVHKYMRNIGYRAFYRCEDLKSFEIDKESKYCGISAQSLGLCKNLTKIKMPYYAENAFRYDGCDDEECDEEW